MALTSANGENRSKVGNAL